MTDVKVREIIETLGFDPTNHHNAAKCPYCTPAAHVAEVDRLTKQLKDPWMHIALAPKTGEHILVADRNGFGWGVCGGKRQWPTAVVHWWDHPGEQGWYLSVGGDQEFLNPTHFQLIEAPPRDVEYPCGCSASAGSPSYCPIHGESDLSIGDVHRSEVQEIKTKFKAAEQRISELTCANEEKAKKIVGLFVAFAPDTGPYQRKMKQIVAILNGGQQ